ncbi:histidine kinase [Acinetobacter cumulans]|uniref:histidine kinase n=1 Tax=Acinetobacter cumulans TaxID=2136182 RepID=A0A498CZH1_9GAMM|nr:ATP-binding protein [Acinetobacter cumulans]RLL36367.1 histidine kinase [Acinetobacter cumulans]
MLKQHPIFLHLTAWVSLFCLFVLCFGLFGFSASAHANFEQAILKQECTAHIQNIYSAKGSAHYPENIPQQGWQKLQQLPDRWHDRWPNYHGNAWYKIEWNYQCPNPTVVTPISLSIESITQTGQVFINDNLLWRDIATTEPISRNQVKPHLWNIPIANLHQGKNIIWIQVQGNQIQKSGIGHVALGDYTQMYKLYNSWLLEKQTLPYFNSMINMVIGLFCLLVWMISRKESAFFWFAMVSFLWVSYSTLVIYADPISFLTSVQLERIQNIIFCFYVAISCLGAWRFAGFSFPRIEKALFGFAIIASTCIAVSPIEYAAQVIQVFFGITVLIFIAKCISYPYFAYKSRLPETYFLAVTYVVFVPIAIHDAIFMSTLQGKPLSPYTAPFSSAVIGFVLAFRLARNAREIERFNQTLTQNIKQTKQELTESLGLQQKLAVQNARLQERINLSHDLHDGLGGSIFRSMVLLEQNEKIEKNQVLSILKLLRSDLRQVIDSGASLGAEIPATPIDWATTIRHRFVQLFEELDIRSTWELPQHWGTSPTALQCLTLTRLVEEALTNIMKHSQATQVTIRLHENDVQQLVLSIIDNGCGFTPQADQFGLHVGLQSMQTRIQRIGGTFSIESQPGHTQIQAILPLQNNMITPKIDP